MARVHKITNLRFTPHTISFNMDGERVWDRVQISPYVPYVGRYDRTKPVIRLDKKITDPKQRRSLEVHEACERCDRYHHDMPAHPAHVVAEATEHRVARTTLRMSRHDWHRYGEDVETVFRQNAREGVRRRR